MSTIIWASTVFQIFYYLTHMKIQVVEGKQKMEGFTYAKNIHIVCDLCLYF